MQIYLRSHRRRPIRVYPWQGSADAQGQIPWFWCCRCGREVFERGMCLCYRCQKEDKDGEGIL